MSDVWDPLAADPVAFVCSEPETTEPTVHLICQTMPPVGRLLDLGCGQGRLGTAVADRLSDVRVTGVDVSPAMLAAAEQHPRVDYAVTDGQTLPDGMFDGAWSVLVFQHLELWNIGEYIEQLPDHLMPGAPVVVQWVPGNQHVGLDQRHPVADIVDLFDWNGFDVKSVAFDIHPDWVWLTARRLG